MKQEKKRPEPKPKDEKPSEPKILKLLEKLFYGLNLSWKNLIIASVVIGIFVGILMCIPALTETSFTRIGVILYWWVLFGTIIITNSKTNLDSALKCFVFFLISQPLIYLVQVPFSHMGWGLFGYYRYWFMWTIATLPLGFIGHWLLARKNILSTFVLAAALVVVMLEGAGEFNIAFRQFPKYFLSGIFCVLIAIVMILGVFKDWKLRGITIAVAIVAAIIVAFIFRTKPEDLVIGLVFSGDDYGITIEKEWTVESEFGSRMHIDKEPTYDENGNETGEYWYAIYFTGNANDYGTHNVKFISEDEAKNCQIEIGEKGSTLTCD